MAALTTCLKPGAGTAFVGTVPKLRAVASVMRRNRANSAVEDGVFVYHPFPPFSVALICIIWIRLLDVLTERRASSASLSCLLKTRSSQVNRDL